MTVEIVLAIIATISGIIAGVYKYREAQLQEQTKLQVGKTESTLAIVNTLVGRIDTLENKQDILNDKLYAIGKQAAEDRAQLIQSHEEKIEQVRKEMRRLIDDSNLELATWRDRYFTLMEEYRTLKVEYSALDCRFREMESEVNKLRAMYYKRRKGDTLEDIVEDPDFIA